MVADDSELYSEELAAKPAEDNSEILKTALEGNEGNPLPKYFYEVEFEKPGGIVMPIIAEYTYADGTKERVKYPVQLWRKNDASVTKLITSDKELIGVTIDPDEETADIDLSNNAWPKEEEATDFDQFKAKVQG